MAFASTVTPPSAHAERPGLVQALLLSNKEPEPCRPRPSSQPRQPCRSVRPPLNRFLRSRLRQPTTGPRSTEWASSTARRVRVTRPTVLLLHGYPSSSRQWDPLLPLLADRYHLIAPDYPGFGQSDAPSPAKYTYTFDNLAKTMEGLVAHLGIRTIHAVPAGLRWPGWFPHGAGSPRTGQRADRPERQCLRGRARAEVAGHRSVLGRSRFPPRAGRRLHLARRSQTAPSRYQPQSRALQSGHLGRRVRHPRATGRAGDPGGPSLRLPHQRRVLSAWQAWLRGHPLPTLVLWGRYDPSFIVPGAEAYLRDVPKAELHILDAGHFALDEATDEVARLTRDFLGRVETSALPSSPPVETPSSSSSVRHWHNRARELPSGDVGFRGAAEWPGWARNCQSPIAR